jgi:solute carrier family 13 (sodium-dependent dicarboxylate transporter), member 2/3/5
LTLGMVTALAANWGFMMPAGTPSLALAYGTGRLTAPQMAFAGLFMDLGGVVLILVICLGVGALVS